VLLAQSLTEKGEEGAREEVLSSDLEMTLSSGVRKDVPSSGFEITCQPALVMTVHLPTGVGGDLR
jgi:hypothetical protein